MAETKGLQLNHSGLESMGIEKSDNFTHDLPQINVNDDNALEILANENSGNYNYYVSGYFEDYRFVWKWLC